MLPGDIDAVIAGRHGDPFRVLGPHPLPEGGYEVWTFQPQAVRVNLITEEATVEMDRQHEGGLFLANLPDSPGRYRFEIHGHGDHVYLVEDPYRFFHVLTPFQLHLLAEGTNYQSYLALGSHLTELDGIPGCSFAVWAPNAQRVSVVGDFNGWDSRRNPMRKRDSGVWEIFMPGVAEGTVYKYAIVGAGGGEQMKADPYAFHAEVPPRTGSVVTSLAGYEWNDADWMDRRAQTDILREPVSVYEVHLGSWLRADGNRMLSYRELATKLVTYCHEMGYTHIELMPVMEHPFGGSWGYQVTGFYAPTSRFGSPDDFRYFVDRCHQAGIGVILDWVPGHFPRDAHGLAWFDGTALYEHEDPRQGAHRDWGTLIFNYGRREVSSFLLSNALYWLREFHLDGLRVDAVASMLYLDYSREHGDWIPNEYGGRENLEAIEFLKIFNQQVHQVPGAFTVAEESTSFPAVSRPVYAGGLGFTLKWNMGWMHDMFKYFKPDPIFRKYHHNNLTFSLLYAFTENFLLPISHDEVVHGKGSLIGKMPGDEWQRFANVRLFLAYMYTHPGKKLLFMGQEIGQYEEWNEDRGLRWELLEYAPHKKLQSLVRTLNHLYKSGLPFHDQDFSWEGFEWVDFRDVENSVLAFLRWSRDGRFIVVCCNFTPTVRTNYRLGVPQPGVYREVLNTDADMFGGSNVGNGGRVIASENPSHGRPASFSITLPPLAALIFELEDAH